MLNFGASKPRVKGEGARAPGAHPPDPRLQIFKGYCLLRAIKSSFSASHVQRSMG